MLELHKSSNGDIMWWHAWSHSQAERKGNRITSILQFLFSKCFTDTCLTQLETKHKSFPWNKELVQNPVSGEIIKPHLFSPRAWHHDHNKIKVSVKNYEEGIPDWRFFPLKYHPDPPALFSWNVLHLASSYGVSFFFTWNLPFFGYVLNVLHASSMPIPSLHLFILLFLSNFSVFKRQSIPYTNYLKIANMSEKKKTQQTPTNWDFHSF